MVTYKKLTFKFLSKVSGLPGIDKSQSTTIKLFSAFYNPLWHFIFMMSFISRKESTPGLLLSDQAILPVVLRLVQDTQESM